MKPCSLSFWNTSANSLDHFTFTSVLSGATRSKRPLDFWSTIEPSLRTSPDLEVINKKEYTGIDKDGKVKFKHHSSADSVRKAKDFKKAITRSGGDKRGKVHDVSILPDDAFREKNQNKGRMPLGRSLVKGVKDIPKHLKAAGAKKGKIVVGKPNAVLPDEDKKTGAEKRGRLYSKILGSRASKRSKKTGVMVGTVR